MGRFLTPLLRPSNPPMLTAECCNIVSSNGMSSEIPDFLIYFSETSYALFPASTAPLEQTGSRHCNLCTVPQTTCECANRGAGSAQRMQRLMGRHTREP